MRSIHDSSPMIYSKMCIRDRLKTIPPLQAFMVSLRLDGTPNVYFPTAPEYSVLVDPNSSEGKGAELRSTDEERDELSERYVAVKVTDAEGGYTSAVLLPEDTDEDVYKRQNQSNPYIDVISPMTAEYEHVDFTGGGTKGNPRQIELSNPYGRTKGIELLRTFAKVELLYKKCIWLSWDENGKEQLKWIGPWRFQHPYGPHLYDIPKDVSLFPIQEYSSAQDTVVGFLLSLIHI